MESSSDILQLKCSVDWRADGKSFLLAPPAPSEPLNYMAYQPIGIEAMSICCAERTSKNPIYCNLIVLLLLRVSQFIPRTVAMKLSIGTDRIIFPAPQEVTRLLHLSHWWTLCVIQTSLVAPCVRIPWNVFPRSLYIQWLVVKICKWIIVVSCEQKCPHLNSTWLVS